MSDKMIKLEGQALTVVKALVTEDRMLKERIGEIRELIWQEINNYHPETKEGAWRLDTQYMKHDVLVVAEQEDCCSTIDGILSDLFNKK